jgi:hypothetical protein
MVGCPRNNQCFFRFELKQTETQSVSAFFGLFSRNQKTFFSVCFGVSDRYRNNRKKPKNFQKTFPIRGSWKQLIFFFSRFEPKQTELNLFHLFFGFFAKPKKIFRLVSVFRTGIETTETNRTYGTGNLKSLYFN